MVELFPIEDHNPPQFLQIIEFCRQVDHWLKTNEKNVAIVHCKAGKVKKKLIENEKCKLN